MFECVLCVKNERKSNCALCFFMVSFDSALQSVLSAGSTCKVRGRIEEKNVIASMNNKRRKKKLQVSITA